MRYLALVSLLLAAMASFSLQAVETVYSPDRNICVNMDVKDGVPMYNVLYKGKQVIRDSRLGLDLVSAKGSGKGTNFNNKVSIGRNSMQEGFDIMKTDYSSFDETWTPVWGEESSIRNHYNEMKVSLIQDEFGRYIVVKFRVYNDGVGFRYEFPEQDNLTPSSQCPVTLPLGGLVATMTPRSMSTPARG